MKIARHRDAAALEAALTGGSPRHDAETTLVSLAAELRHIGLETPVPVVSTARRDELRAAVLAQRARDHRDGGLARARGAVVGIAAIAGAGLVAASAATGSNPAVLVVEAARDIPRLSVRSESPPASIDIQGEVIATHDGGRTLELRGTEDTVVVVHAPRESRAVTEAGTPVPASNIVEGTTVRVTADRDGTAGPIEAKKIEVVPAATSAPRNDPTLTAALAPDTKPTLASGGAATSTQRPSRTNTPVPTPTPKPAVTSVAIVPIVVDPAPDPTATATPTRKPDPRRTPVSTNQDPAPLEKNLSDTPADTSAAY